MPSLCPTPNGDTDSSDDGMPGLAPHAVRAQNQANIFTDLAHYRTVIASLENPGPRGTRTAISRGAAAPSRHLFAPCTPAVAGNPRSWAASLLATTPTTVDVSAPYLRGYRCSHVDDARIVTPGRSLAPAIPVWLPWHTAEEHGEQEADEDGNPETKS